MQFSQKTEYALHSLLYLACKQEVILVDKIAAEQNISKSYLAKVMQKLSNAGLVKSYVGASGGYTLAKSAAEISFADVVRIFETEEQVLDCLDQERNCPAGPSCKILTTLNDAYQEMIDRLEETTIQDLVTKVKPVEQEVDWL